MSESTAQLISKIEKYPVLMNRVERLLEIIKNEDGRATLADDAEARVIVEMREMGKEILQEWAKDESQRQEEAVLKSGVVVKKKSKKNSTGTPLMEP